MENSVTSLNKTEEREPSLGAILKERRLSLKLSLKDVSEALKIRGVFLEDIEKDQWTKLPGLTYTKGFIRSYAKFLKIEEVIKPLYDEIFEIPPFAEEKKSDGENDFSSKTLLIIGWVVIALVVGYYLFF